MAALIESGLTVKSLPGDQLLVFARLAEPESQLKIIAKLFKRNAEGQFEDSGKCFYENEMKIKPVNPNEKSIALPSLIPMENLREDQKKLCLDFLLRRAVEIVNFYGRQLVYVSMEQWELEVQVQ